MSIVYSCFYILNKLCDPVCGWSGELCMVVTCAQGTLLHALKQFSHGQMISGLTIRDKVLMLCDEHMQHSIQRTSTYCKWHDFCMFRMKLSYKCLLFFAGFAQIWSALVDTRWTQYDLSYNTLVHWTTRPSCSQLVGCPCCAWPMLVGKIIQMAGQCQLYPL